MSSEDGFNKYNHNERANPHPQYNAQQLYYTKYNPGNKERWVCIFQNTFQQKVGRLPVEERCFNRLIFSAYFYSMDNENKQGMCMFNFYAMVIGGSQLLIEADGRHLMGSPDYSTNFKICYKTIKNENNNKQYDVRIYAKLQYAYERIKFQPLIFDPVSNYNTPFHMESAKSGVNTYERLQAQFNSIPNNDLLLPEDLAIELEGYAIKEIGLSYGYFKAKTIAIDSTVPKIDFRYAGEQKGTLQYDNDKQGFYLLSSVDSEGNTTSKKVATNMSILPTKTNTTIGNAGSPWNAGFFNAISLKLYYTISSIPAGCSLAILNKSDEYTGLIYKYGNYWYKASDNKLIID